MALKQVRPAMIATLALGLTLVVSGCSLFGQPRDDAGVLTAEVSIHINNTRVGDCLVDFQETADEVSDVKAVPCTVPHDAEVFGRTENVLASADYWAQHYCLQEFTSYVGIEWDDSILRVSYLSPKVGDSDKVLVCVTYEKGVTDSTTSLKGAAR
ncbi:MAG: septum formation family protein [Propionibacteriaceae bacterium]|jgi:hypothetical protein|nr:septum formation family protein [Propionibacteriaceae bacterium]